MGENFLNKFCAIIKDSDSNKRYISFLRDAHSNLLKSVIDFR